MSKKKHKQQIGGETKAVIPIETLVSTKAALADDFRVVFTWEAWEKINAYIRFASGEVSGLGRIRLEADRWTVTVLDVYLWKQECTVGTTEVIDHEAVFSLVERLKKEGVNPSELGLWWHSHANMDAFFSGIDDTTIDEWINDSFLVAVVGNKAGKYKAKIAIKAPIPCILTADVLYHPRPEDREKMERYREEIEENVTVLHARSSLTPETTGKPAIEGYWSNGVFHKFTERSRLDDALAEDGLSGKEWEDDDRVPPVSYSDDGTTEKSVAERLVSSAEACNCAQCLAFIEVVEQNVPLAQYPEHFPYATHDYDKLNDIYFLRDTVTGRDLL